MKLSFDLINSFLVHPYQGVDDPKLHKNIQLISQNFNIDRTKIDQYLQNDELVSAYTAFYFPTNFIKLRKLFELLPQNLVESLGDYDVIDIGSGPGTYAAAFLEYFPNFKNNLFLIETSDSMVRQAKKAIRGLFPEFRGLLANQKISGEKKRLLIFGNSLNEMGTDRAQSYIEHYAADTVILLEPGTPQAFEKILPLRDYLIQKKFNIVFPCPKKDECPIKNDSGNWCHQIFFEVHDASIETLSQYLKKDRRTMPVIAHVYTKQILNSEKVVTIFRVLNESKFSFNFEVCLGNEIRRIEVMKKDYDKKIQKEIAGFLAGMPVKYQVQKEFPDYSRVLLNFSCNKS